MSLKINSLKGLLFILIIMNSSIEAQSKFYDYVYATIRVESNKLLIEREGNIISTFELHEGYFVKMSFYDSKTKLLSVLLVKRVSENKDIYKLTVYDPFSTEHWDILTGESEMEEQGNYPLIYNYNPEQNSGLIWYAGWEGNWIKKYNEGNIEELKNVGRWDHYKILAFTSKDEVLLRTSNPYDDEMNVYYQIYNLNENIRRGLSEEEVEGYARDILNYCGERFNLFWKNSKKERKYSKAVWSPTGNAFIYSEYNKKEKTYSNILYDEIYQIKIKYPGKGNFINVIWQN